MKIIVDGDGCAGRDIIEEEAKASGIGLIIYCDINHFISSDYAEVKIIDSGFQSVDMAVVNSCKEGDIVVSQDYGVAAMTLSKKAMCLSPSGYIYDNDNIDRLLMERHIKSKIRRGGGKTSNPRKRTSEDDDKLRFNLRKLISKSTQK